MLSPSPKLFQKLLILVDQLTWTKGAKKTESQMVVPSPDEVTRLLVDWGNGDQGVLDELSRFDPLTRRKLRDYYQLPTRTAYPH